VQSTMTTLTFVTADVDTTLPTNIMDDSGSQSDASVLNNLAQNLQFNV
jgi:hypothetical protein